MIVTALNSLATIGVLSYYTIRVNKDQMHVGWSYFAIMCCLPSLIGYLYTSYKFIKMAKDYKIGKLEELIA